MTTTRKPAPFVVPGYFAPNHLADALDEVGLTRDVHELQDQVFALACCLLSAVVDDELSFDSDAAEILSVALYRLQKQRARDIERMQEAQQMPEEYGAA